MKKFCYCIALIMLVGVLSGCTKKPVLELKQEIFTLELGEAVNLDPYYYLNTDQLSEDEKTKLDQEMLFAVYTPEGSVRTQDGKAYPMPGSYDGSIAYKKETVNFKVEVKDTVAPVITGLESIELAAGTELNYAEYYSATDLNDMEEIQYDTSTIDVNTEGTYTLKIAVKDAAGNEGIKEVPVTIKGVTDQQETSSEVVTNEDGTQSYVTTITDKPVYVEPETPSYPAPSGGNTNPTSQTPPHSQGSENTAGNNSNATNDSQSTPKPDRTESICTPTVWNSGLLFDSLDEARVYAEDFMMSHIEKIGGYGLLTTCGKTTISWTYY